MLVPSPSRRDSEDYGDQILSKVVKAGRRTYFFDVRATRGDDWFLTITESRKITAADGSSTYDRHKIFLYTEDFTKFAFELSEKYDTPVILRLTTRVAHSQSLVELCEREEHPAKQYERNIAKYVMMPANARVKHVVVEERTAKLSEDSNEFSVNRIEEGSKELGIICSGGVYQYVKEALPQASVLKLGTVWPLPYKLIERFAKSVKRCIVAEELAPHLETQIKAHGIAVEGKNIFPLCGEFTANLIRKCVLGEQTETKSHSVPARPPVLCAGCPHRGVFYVLSKLKLNVLGDIGCYTLGAVPPLGSMDAVVCMGASIGMAIGFDKADPEAHRRSVAVIGDSTFIHSGITGLIDAVYNKAKVTVIILDNRTTGMTGHQNHPATGKTIKNEPTYELDLAEVCRATGVQDVVTVDPGDLKATEQAVKNALSREEVSVVIAKKPCALLTKKLYNSMVQEVSSKQIGEMVMEGLKELDEVAYVRYASVYRSFKDISSFMRELQQMMEYKAEEEQKGERHPEKG